MKLVKVKIKNFRCYKDEFVVAIDDLTAIIAKNDVGKSTILDALDAFFNLEKLEAGDRCVGCRNSENVEITCTFDKLPNEMIVDTDNLIIPSNEFLLDSNGQLTITKTFSGAAMKCESVKIHAVHPSKDGYSDLFDLTISQLRTRANELSVDLGGVDSTIKSSIRHAIWAHIPIEEIELQLRELEVKTTIWKTVEKSLPLYQLFKSDRASSDQDAEAQDPIKFAIKEALKQREELLDEVGSFVKQQVEELTLNTIEKLREMDPSLANQLDPNFGNINWTKVFTVSLTNENQIPLNKRGSGVRRLFLLNFFRARAEQMSTSRDVQDVIYAIEEPETSQHPNNQLMLLEAFKELVVDDKCQVILTTHNPILAGKIDKESIRFIVKNEDGNREIAPNDVNTVRNIANSLGMFANHNVKVFVGVEGPNDIEFIKRASKVLTQHYEDIKDLEKAEAEGNLVFIPMGGSTLELWTNRLEGLEIPEVHIMDRDYQPPLPAKYQMAADAVNGRGAFAFITNKREMENYLHIEAINAVFNTSFAEHFQDFEDVPALVAKAQNENEGGTIAWDERDEEWKKKKISRAKRRLNRDVLLCMDKDKFNHTDPHMEIVTWLKKISSYLN